MPQFTNAGRNFTTFQAQQHKKINMKIYQISILAAVVALIASCGGRSINPKKNLKTSMDSFSYIVGNQVGNYLRGQGVEKLDYSSLVKGIEDAMLKDSGFAIKAESMEGIQQAYVMKEQEKKIKVLQEATKKWVAENAKNAGVVALPSKGQFKMVKKGTGPMPGPYDTVEYTMVVKDQKGNLKGDTRSRGVNPKDPVNKLFIAPIQEAFQQAPEGSTFEVYIQNDVYPRLGRQESLEDKFGITILTVELLKVTPGKAPAPGSEPKEPTMDGGMNGQ
jgi:FKBP-type peptidyl-prolyl cis-trans isomerase FklB